MSKKEVSKGRPINVSLRVIADLSQGLYRSPADALKELINNAYDANSPSVDINIDSDATSVQVNDQGEGMFLDDFIRVMESIGGSSKREETGPQTTASGRPLIGRIGIGLLSVSQIANHLEVFSKKRNSTVGFKAYIQFDQFASEQARKTKITEIWLDDESPIEIGKYYITEVSGLPNTSQYTRLTLSQVKPAIRSGLLDYKKESGFERQMGITCMGIEELLVWMRNKNVTKAALHEYDRLYLDLCTLCPVAYLDEALDVVNNIKGSSPTSKFTEFANEVNKETHFTLYFDKLPCKKPVKMPLEYDRQYELFFNLLFMNGIHDRLVEFEDFTEHGDKIIKTIKMRGYFYFQKRRIWPPEMAGVLIRVRNVAVGQYDSTFLNYRRNEGIKFQQLSGEIYVDDLDNALNIDRSSFRETEASFVQFRETIHNYLAKSVFPGIKMFGRLNLEARRSKGRESYEAMLSRTFTKLDKKGRKLRFVDDSDKFLSRDKNTVVFARKVKGKKVKMRDDSLRMILFMESTLRETHSDAERDALYDQFLRWIPE